MRAEQLLNITLRLMGLELDQLQSLIDGSQNPHDYNPNALAQIESALTGLYHSGFLEKESLLEVVSLSQMMRGASE